MEYEAGIENSDYDEIDDTIINLLWECSVKPLNSDDLLIKFLGECSLKLLIDEDPCRGPAEPRRGRPMPIE